MDGTRHEVEMRGVVREKIRNVMAFKYLYVWPCHLAAAIDKTEAPAPRCDWPPPHRCSLNEQHSNFIWLDRLNVALSQIDICRGFPAQAITLQVATGERRLYLSLFAIGAKNGLDPVRKESGC